MKNLMLLFLAVALTASASPVCLNAPIMSPDGQTLCNDAPGIGDLIVGTSRVYWEDAPGGSDFDFNDAVVDIIYQGNGEVVAQWVGSVAAYYNIVVYDTSQVHALSPGPTVIANGFLQGDELILGLLVLNTGDVWYSGPGTRNSDLVAHALVAEIPEPSTVVHFLIGSGLLLFGRITFLRRKEKVKN